MTAPQAVTIPRVCPLKITKEDKEFYNHYPLYCGQGFTKCGYKDYLACPKFSEWYWKEVTENAGRRAP
mgnify:CR=1 FL=1